MSFRLPIYPPWTVPGFDIATGLCDWSQSTTTATCDPAVVHCQLEITLLVNNQQIIHAVLVEGTLPLAHTPFSPSLPPHLPKGLAATLTRYLSRTSVEPANGPPALPCTTGYYCNSVPPGPMLPVFSASRPGPRSSHPYQTCYLWRLSCLAVPRGRNWNRNARPNGCTATRHNPLASPLSIF